MALGLTLSLVGRIASADVVSPAPTNCMDGTTPQTGHCGPYCGPRSCTANADCGPATCQSVALCVVKIVCAGLVPPDADLSAYERQKVTGTCPNGQCSEGECQSLNVCLSSTGPLPTSTVPAGGSSGNTGGQATAVGGAGGSAPVDSGRACGCKVARTGELAPWPTMACLLCGLWAIRRRVGKPRTRPHSTVCSTPQHPAGWRSVAVAGAHPGPAVGEP